MGTPEFAVASLDALVQAGCNIVGVVTAPDKPAGRGMQLQQSAVKKFAVEHGLHLLQPEKLKNPAFIEELRSLKADLQVVVAFRMLPEVVWSMPRLGTINLHASLLPQYRGAAPINWAVINGEKETGVTTFRLQHEIDTGGILMQAVLPVGHHETAGELHDRMKLTGAQLLVETILGLANGTLQETPQENWKAAQGDAMAGRADEDESKSLKHAPKIFTDTCRINWNKPVKEIYNLVRGLSPYPAAFTTLDGKILKIYKAEMAHAQPKVDPGTHETDGKTFLRFAATDGYLYLHELQLEGKKRMNVEDFLRGFRKM